MKRNGKGKKVCFMLVAAFLMTGLASIGMAATLKVGAGLDPTVPGNYTTIAAATAAAKSGDVISRP